MKIVKNYQSFIRENKTTAEKIVDLVEDDSYSKTLITQYCSEFDSSIDLLSALSLLTTKKQETILNLIKKYKFKKTIDDSIVNTHTDLNLLESNSPLAGKNLFTCFLKVLSALGQKNISTDWNLTPDDFLFYFISEELDYLDIRMVFSRFKYLDLSFNNVSKSNQTACLYYGIKTDMTIEYGVNFKGVEQKIGHFNLSEDNLNSLIGSNFLALSQFKLIFTKIDYRKLKLLSKIKQELLNFKPGFFEQKSKPVIKDGIITFAYFGVGTWDNGFMDNNEYENVKTNLRNFLVQFSWIEQIKMSVVTKDLWIYINLKPKDLKYQ
jgi:hypothetical protein